MKKNLWWLIGLALANAGSSQTLLTGLVGYWSFDEGSGTVVADGSGQGNHGTLVNGGSGRFAGWRGRGLAAPPRAGL